MCGVGAPAASSGGMQRRLELASALVHDPALLFLDEPTAGIDPLLRATIWEELHRLRDDGRTLLVTTQYVNEAEDCDSVALIADGRLIATAAPASCAARPSAAMSSRSRRPSLRCGRPARRPGRRGPRAVRPDPAAGHGRGRLDRPARRRRGRGRSAAARSRPRRSGGPRSTRSSPSSSSATGDRRIATAREDAA